MQTFTEDKKSHSHLLPVFNLVDHFVLNGGDNFQKIFKLLFPSLIWSTNLIKEFNDLKNFDVASHARKKGRYYHRIMSGVTFATYKKQTLRWGTLTTSDKSKFSQLPRDFDVLVKRIRRKFPYFNYWKLNATEGNGVIHFIYTGSYIPKKWLVANWNDIHSSYIVDIQFIRSPKKVTNYLVSHYLANHASYSRMSWSQGWLFRGAISRWNAICKAVKQGYFHNDFHNKYYKNKKEVPFKVILDIMVSLWNKYLYYHSFTQMTITSYPMGA